MNVRHLIRKPAPASEPESAIAAAQRQQRTYNARPQDILGTGPHCTGGCHQGRALCVHPEACGVQRPVAEAVSELLADPPRRISDQDRGERIGSAIGWSVVALLCVLGAIHVAHVYGIGPGLARVAGWVASFFR